MLLPQLCLGSRMSWNFKIMAHGHVGPVCQSKTRYSIYYISILGGEKGIVIVRIVSKLGKLSP